MDSHSYAIRPKSSQIAGGCANQHNVSVTDQPESSECENVRTRKAQDTLSNSSKKTLKLIICIILFVLVLGSSVLSKLSILFMTSHIAKNRKVEYCNIKQRDIHFKAIIPDKERIAWIWSIVFTYAVTEMITFCKALFRKFKKNTKTSGYKEFFIVLTIETIHVIGMGLLMFNVLPNLNVIQGVMLTNCLCLVPAILNLVSNWNARKGTTKWHTMAVCAQATGFFVWPYINNNPALWTIPIAIAFISFHWWENFITMPGKINMLKKSIDATRLNTYFYVSAWKIFVFLNCANWFADIRPAEFYDQFATDWKNHRIEVYEPPNSKLIHLEFSTPTALYWTIFIQITSSLVCYLCTRLACKIKVELQSFILPLNLTVPVAIGILLSLCRSRALDVCTFHNVIPDYLFFVPPPVFSFTEYILKEYGWFWILWLVSQIWIIRQIWKSASSDKLFVTPLYNTLIIDQSLMLNRRKHYRLNESATSKSGKDDIVPLLYVCVTMWHEDESEMLTFFNTIFRLDQDHSRQKSDKRAYDMETHIFFDDAFSDAANENVKYKINVHVQTFIDCLNLAAEEFNISKQYFAEPIKSDTPYGGLLEWTLPGQSKMIVHLKNSDKIRKKKRWSLVMYMRFLLFHRMPQQFARLNAVSDSMIQLKNTFILALDGDIDFQPEAIHMLIDRMKADEDLAVVCGRIHPIGDGPMVWYQKFEYAISHWLQKTTEHVFGSVLCSPGCFSLFRGHALRKREIIDKFSTRSIVANDFVQYDQGEDRWLCTLLLKHGFKIVYVSTSHAYTHCPKTFIDIFKQRMRWITSTIANSFDFLSNAKAIVNANKHISMLYVIYQAVLMIGTIIGPGTIFLMMAGAMAEVLEIGETAAFWLNFIPIAVYMLICYQFQKYQFYAALLLTGLYAMVMMTVLVGVLINFMRGDTGSPAAIFFIIVTGQIIITAILHPKERFYLFYGIVYYLIIPAMYMLLTIYAIFNLNHESWGTRDTSTSSNDESITKQNNLEQPGIPNVIMQFAINSTITIQMSTRKPGTAPPLAPPLPKNPQKSTSSSFDWKDDHILTNGIDKELTRDETRFWKETIKNYLDPEPAKGNPKLLLAELRDSCAYKFILVNALYVLVVYIFQLHKDYFYIQWPFGAKEEEQIDEQTLETTVKLVYFLIDPLGLLFMVCFGSILVIQFIAMLIYRLDELGNVLATTKLSFGAKWFRDKNNNTTVDNNEYLRNSDPLTHEDIIIDMGMGEANCDKNIRYNNSYVRVQSKYK